VEEDTYDTRDSLLPNFDEAVDGGRDQTLSCSCRRAHGASVPSPDSLDRPVRHVPLDDRHVCPGAAGEASAGGGPGVPEALVPDQLLSDAL